jgi:hypothetical protein
MGVFNLMCIFFPASTCIHATSIRNNELHYLNFTEIPVARSVGTGSFLTRYSNGDTK